MGNSEKALLQGEKIKSLKNIEFDISINSNVDTELGLNIQLSVVFNRDARAGDNNLGVPVSDVL